MNLKGSSTTIGGIIAILSGAVGILQQILSLVNGHPVDTNIAVVSAGAVSAGVGLVKAADAKQAE